MLPFGFSLFEKVYRYDNDKIILEKLASRKQATIKRRTTADGRVGVEQRIPYSDDDTPNWYVDIPAEKLVLFTFRQEGDNYEGVSILRSAYKHRRYKDNLYKFDAVKHERQSVWIPVIYPAEWATEDDLAIAETIVKNIRANEEWWIVMPWPKSAWREIEFMSMNASSTSDLRTSINHHNREISKNILAQFLELWNTESWSRALSEDQSDLFLLWLTAIANHICDIFNRFVIPELVDYNFNVSEYPHLKFNKLWSVDYTKLSGALTSLASWWLLTPDENLEVRVRDIMDLPSKVIEEWTEEEIDEEIEDTAEDDLDQIDEEEEIVSDDSIDELDSLLDDMDQADDEQFCEILESVVDCCESYEIQMFALTDEQKKKISEWLKKYRDKKGRKSVDDVTGEIDKKTEEVKNYISQQKEKFTAKVDWIRNEIDKIRSANTSWKKMTKEQKAKVKQQVKALRDKIKALRLMKKIETERIKKKLADLRAIKKETKSAWRTLAKADNEAKKKSREAERAKKKALRDQEKARKKQEREAKKLKKNKASSIQAHEHHHDHEDFWHFDDEYWNISQMFDNRFIISLQNEASDGDQYADIKKKWFKVNEFEKIAPRPLTFAERKVNFVSLKKSVDSFEQILDEKFAEITTEMKEDLLKQVKDAVENNDIKAVWQISAKYTWKLSAALTEVQKEMFEIGKKTAAVEMNVQVPPTKKEVRGALRVQNDNIIEWFSNAMNTQTRSAVLTVVNENAWSITAATAASAVSAASQSIDATIAKVANNLKTLWLIGAVNLWRATIFERYPEKVYWFQYSAILDEKTTDYCRSLDGRVVEPWSKEFFKYMPPKHYNCRSIRVEILQEETFKPQFTWIPSSIPAPATIDTFKPLKAPQILKDSPAVVQLQVELKQRKDKLKELEDADQYPNRQAAHKERIDQLETALANAMSEAMYAETKALLMSEWISFKTLSE